MLRSVALPALLLAAFTQSAAAQDYIAIKVEAESYTQKNSLWRVFSNNSQPNVNPDPDGSHHSSASGRAYLELLPDTRVTHDDQLRTGTNFWPTGGQGPGITYTVNFPESGRYTVWAKAYSTGTEDNGIHVGINGTNPESGQRMQWCGGKNNWTWSSAQRASTNHCGTARTIFLDVPFAGASTITFTAREDGFELDQFMLIKEKASGLVCAPAGNDNINCNRSATGTTTDNQSNNDQNDSSTDQTDTTTESQDEPDEVQPSDTPSSSANPVCTSGTSDPDGDGWGWEDGSTCLSTGDHSAASGSNTDVPVCSVASADEDGDGWGWENYQTCVIDGSAAQQMLLSSPTFDAGNIRYCDANNSDSDGDGWGWENDQSCVMR